MGKYDRNTTKSQLLGKSGKGQLNQSNKFSSIQKRETKEFKLENGVFQATRHVIDANEVKSKTCVHRLNPRNQQALNDESVEGTLRSIRENGIDTDCLGIWSEGNTKIEIIEGSVRRYCAIESNRSYPVWVLPADCATNKDIRRLVIEASDKKPHSLRERGEAYWNEVKELTEDVDGLTNNDIAELISVGKETVRKAIQAFKLDINLLKVFPDYEGIPNTFYGKLARIEKLLAKKKVNTQEFLERVLQDSAILTSKELPKDERQAVIMGVMEKYELKLKGAATGWVTTELVSFESKNKHARKQVSGDGNSVKFELSRVDKSLIADIENLIKERLA